MNRENQRLYEILQDVVSDAEASTGHAFFSTLVLKLASAIKADYVLVGELVRPENERVRTIAVCHDGEILDNFIYPLKGSASDAVVGKTICSVVSGVIERFPNDGLLADMGVEGYVGVPLFDSSKKAIGVAVALYKTPNRQPDLAEMILQLFASRIANEIERQRMEMLLKQSEARYRMVVEGQTDFICRFCADGTVTFANKQLAAVVNLAPRDLIGRSFYEFVDEETKQQIQVAVTSIDKDNPLAVHTQRVPLPDGTVRWYQWANRGQFDQEGNLFEYQGVGRDITERVDIENALRHREARYRALIVGIPDLMFRVQSDGTILDFHADDPANLPMPAEKIIGTKLADTPIPSNISEQIMENLRYCLDTDEIQTVEYTLQFGESPSYFEARLVKSGDAEVVAMVRNVTADKQNESERERLILELKHSEKMQAIGQLAGGVAHDFNNLLTGILGYADLLQEQLEDRPELQSYAEQIVVASHRASDLNQKLLAFARKGKYLNQNVDVHGLIDEVVSILKHTIDKRIRIETDLGATASFVSGDPAQLQAAVLNLALNARDAMPGGGVMRFYSRTQTIASTESEGRYRKLTPGTYLVVVVEDTGIGIENEILSRIFEPFFSTKESGKGLGMGLAATYGTINNHNGKINVESSFGRGSRFEVILPLSESSETPVEEAHQDPSVHPGQGHILLIDDEALIRDIASDMLSKLGYDVTICKDGEDGLAVYRENWQVFDMVVLDLVMPKKSGKDTFIEMKKINPEVRVLLASGYSLDDDANELLLLGAKEFIQKPFRKAELSIKVEQVLA